VLQPAPQGAIGGFFRVDLDVDAALFQVLQLVGIQVSRAGDGAAHGFGDGEVGEGRAAHARHDPVLQLGRDGVGLQALEGSVHRELRAGEGCGYRTGTRQIGPGFRVGGQGGEPCFICVTALGQTWKPKPSHT